MAEAKGTLLPSSVVRQETRKLTKGFANLLVKVAQRLEVSFERRSAHAVSELAVASTPAGEPQSDLGVFQLGHLLQQGARVSDPFGCVPGAVGGVSHSTAEELKVSSQQYTTLVGAWIPFLPQKFCRKEFIQVRGGALGRHYQLTFAKVKLKPKGPTLFIQEVQSRGHIGDTTCEHAVIEVEYRQWQTFPDASLTVLQG